MKNTPKIRFKDYTDEWEILKLGEISEKVTEKNNDYEYTETLTNSAEYGIIIQRDFFEKDISNPEKTDGYYIVREDDFVYNPRISTFAPVGPINRNKLGKPGIMSPLYTVFRTSNINRKYLEYYFKSTKWHNFMYLNGDTGARADRFAIKNSVFMELPIPYPINEEQQKIGEFLNNLDNLVSFYQQKCEHLQTFRKMMLKKMFPQEGCSKPEFRFDGFTEYWEQRKLKEIANYIRGSFPQPYTNPDWFDEKNGRPFVQVADIGFNLKLNDDTKLHISKLAEPKSRFVEKGKVVVALQGSIEKSIGRVAITQYPAFFDRTILIFENYKIDMDKKYFAQIIQNLFKKEKEKAWGATISTITKEALNDFVIAVPKIEEQQKIGSFFKQLDDTIDLHQRKCEKLVEVKKYMLKNMFI